VIKVGTYICIYIYKENRELSIGMKSSGICIVAFGVEKYMRRSRSIHNNKCTVQYPPDEMARKLRLQFHKLASSILLTYSALYSRPCTMSQLPAYLYNLPTNFAGIE